MIEIVLSRTQSGNLFSCTAEGHAYFAQKGQDIVCAAVTVLLRTTLATLEANADIIVKTDAPTRGMLAFSALEKCSDGSASEKNAARLSMLAYAGDFLQEGLSALQSEYPEQVSLKINIVS